MRLGSKRWIAVFGLIVSVLFLAACSTPEETAKVEPAQLEKPEGSEFNRVTLTKRAAERLDIQSTTLDEQEVEGAMKMIVPYSAVLYGLNGETWVYVRNPGAESLTFVRAPISVDRIEGGLAILSAGPPVGTDVVTVGAAELFGADTGVGK